jgi:transposase
MFVWRGYPAPLDLDGPWSGKALEPRYKLCRMEIRCVPIINMGATTLQILKEPGLPSTSTSYLWLFRVGNPERPTVV